MKITVLLFTILTSPTQAVSQEIRTLGVMINVMDIEKAKTFYCTQLGFEIEKEINADFLELKSRDQNKLYLHKVPLLLPEGEKETRASFTLQVNDIDKSIANLTAKGLDFGNEKKRKEGVGYAIYVKNPFEKNVSLMHQTIGDQAPFEEPRIYNYGFMVADMDKAISFYSDILGFQQRSKKYLPLDMPLGHKDESFGFMLHYRVGIEATHFNHPDTEHVVILFQTTDIESAVKSLKKKGVEFLQSEPIDSPIGKHIAFYSPSGYISELYEIR